MEGRSLVLTEVLSRKLPGRTEEHNEDPQDNQCPGRDSNRAPPEYVSRALPLDQPVRVSVRFPLAALLRVHLSAQT
jgi:hypothetical protein